ncbi:hypothetical protein HET69_14310 [Streptomyces sp. CJ_13]|uniref:hypothetical protein n=1 Tax=Streptomyces sp. CJ_13 TaxID=2724943 RepID=UPI001BDC4CFF|nr:hypothetical protein [Streptomyces sp. CJ_13]MBT1185152.1 hypothetical protein [Streptomyces sp. CJ_13]
MSENPTNISRDEVEAFIRKLQTWGEGLDEKERVLLQAVLTPAEDIQSGTPTIERLGFEFDDFTIEVPLETLVGRFRSEQQGKNFYIKESGPSWVRFIQHHQTKKA